MIAGAPCPRVHRPTGDVALRPAEPSDGARILAWNGDPEVRASSLDPRPIDPDLHARWLADRLADPRTQLSVVLYERAPIGLVRIERRSAGGPGRISIVLAPDARGRGLGRATIVAACRADGGDILAEILVHNLISRACFQAAGFCPAPSARSAALDAEFGPTPLRVRRYLWRPAHDPR